MSSSNRERLLAVATLLTISLTVFAQKENMETIADTHHLSAYFVAALMISVFVMIFSNRLFYFRQREVSAQAQQLNTQLGLVLTSNKTQVWTYDVTKHLYTLLSIKGEEEKTYVPIDFSQFFDSNEFTQLHKAVIALPESNKNPSLLSSEAASLKTAPPPASTKFTSLSCNATRKARPKSCWEPSGISRIIE